jgi:hypothetical protein
MNAPEMAITIRAPWSWVIAETAALTALGVAPKAAENRGRRIADKYIGKRIAVHSGQAWCPVGGADERVRRAWWTFGNAVHLREPNPILAEIGDFRTGYVGRLQPTPGLWLEMGAVVAVATLADCHPAAYGGAPGQTCCEPWGEARYNGGDCFHLVLADVVRLPNPVPARGMQAVPWRMPEDVAGRIAAQLADKAAVR